MESIPVQADRNLRVAVIGAGITGLAVAFYLERQGQRQVSIDIFESAGRVGGKVRTLYHDGFVVETGPDAFVITKPDFLHLARDLGLEPRILRARSLPAYIYTTDGLRPLPAGILGPHPLGIRTWKQLRGVPWPVRLHLVRGVLRRFRWDHDVSVEQLSRRLFGNWFTEWVMEPLLVGLYGCDIGDLSAEMALPLLVRRLRERGRLVAFGSKRPHSGVVGSPFRSFPRGLGEAVEALVRALQQTRLHLHRRVDQIVFQFDGIHLITQGMLQGPYAAVVVAMAPGQAVDLLGSNLAPIREHLRGRKCVSVTTITYAVRGTWPVPGTGFLVPRPIRRWSLACTWMSQKWPQRAPDGWLLLRAYLGPEREEEWAHLDDEELARRVWSEVAPPSRLAGSYEQFWVQRWAQGMPLLPVGHRQWLERLQHLCRSFPGLYFAGAGYDGIGLADCVRQARHIARVIRANGR